MSVKDEKSTQTREILRDLCNRAEFDNSNSKQNSGVQQFESKTLTDEKMQDTDKFDRDTAQISAVTPQKTNKEIKSVCENCAGGDCSNEDSLHGNSVENGDLKNTKILDETSEGVDEKNADDILDDEVDGALDDYQQIQNYKDVLFNDLLGDFDEYGEYSISEDILDNLINMPKKIDFIDTTGISARGFFGDRVFKFFITAPVKLENGDAYCYLKLDEQIDKMAGALFVTLTTTIATYCYKFDEFWDQHVREVFCLREYENDDTGEEGRKYRADYIASRYALLYEMRKCSEAYYEKLEEIYFNHRILMLGMDPELTVIMAEFSKKRAKLEPYLAISRRRFYFLNQLLDEVMHLHAERLKKSPIATTMELIDEKYIKKSSEIKERTLQKPNIVELLPKEKNATTTIQMVNSSSKAPAKGVSKGGGSKSKPKSKPKSKGKGGKGGKSGGKKGKDGKKDKPKGPLIGSYSSPQSMADSVLQSFDKEADLDNAKSDLFGAMQM